MILDRALCLPPQAFTQISFDLRQQFLKDVYLSVLICYWLLFIIYHFQMRSLRLKEVTGRATARPVPLLPHTCSPSDLGPKSSVLPLTPQSWDRPPGRSLMAPQQGVVLGLCGCCTLTVPLCHTSSLSYKAHAVGEMPKCGVDLIACGTEPRSVCDAINSRCSSCTAQLPGGAVPLAVDLGFWLYHSRGVQQVAVLCLEEGAVFFLIHTYHGLASDVRGGGRSA